MFRVIRDRFSEAAQEGVHQAAGIKMKTLGFLSLYLILAAGLVRRCTDNPKEWLRAPLASGEVELATRLSESRRRWRRRRIAARAGAGLEHGDGGGQGQREMDNETEEQQCKSPTFTGRPGHASVLVTAGYQDGRRAAVRKREKESDGV